MRVLRRSSSHSAERPPGHGWSSDNKPAIWKPVRTARFRTVRLFTGTAPGLIIPGFSAADHPRSVWRTLNPQTHNTHDCSHLQPLTLACWSAQGQSAAAAARSTRQLRCAPPAACRAGRPPSCRPCSSQEHTRARSRRSTDGAPHPQRLAPQLRCFSDGAPLRHRWLDDQAVLVAAYEGSGVGLCPRGCAVYQIV